MSASSLWCRSIPLPISESPLVPRRHTTTRLFVVLCWCCVWVIYLTQITHFDSHRPADEFDSWDEHNEKALGNITLRVSPSIQTAIANLATVKEVWDHLKENYGAPSIGSAYAELS